MTRKKRKVVAHRSAESGQFVTKEEAGCNPETTVAVTKVEEEGSDKDLNSDGKPNKANA